MLVVGHRSLEAMDVLLSALFEGGSFVLVLLQSLFEACCVVGAI